jgi:hypothetical protein
MNCPVCKSSKITPFRTIESSKISDSLLYGDIILLECADCSHVFNELSEDDIKNLISYYETEYVQNIFSRTFKDEPEKETPDDEFVLSQSNINRYIKYLIALNEWESTEEPCFSFISLNQVLEHCWNLHAVMQFIVNTINKDGYIYIGIPDRSRYDISEKTKIPYFYLIKEHIQHFTVESMQALIEPYGLEIARSYKSYLPILNGKMKMPNVEMLLCKAKNTMPKDGVYCYGAGKELLYAIKNVPYLKGKTISGIIDDVSSKKGKTINDIPIISSSIIPTLNKNSEIIITSIAYLSELKEHLQKFRFRGIVTSLIDFVKKESDIKDEKIVDNKIN